MIVADNLEIIDHDRHQVSMSKLDARARYLFDEVGCFIARGLLNSEEIEPVRQDLRRLIDLRGCLNVCSDMNPQSENPNMFSSRMSSEEVDIMRRALHMLLSSRRIAVSPILERLSCLLLKTQDVEHVAFDDNAEIRPPQLRQGDDLWNRDDIQGWGKELTYWIPLCGCSEGEEIFLLDFGSHKPIFIDLHDGADPIALNHELSEPADASGLLNRRMPLQAGDVLVVSSMLSKREETNTTDRALWALHVRHASLRRDHQRG